MLACARLGVIHSQVFSGFSGKACADRIDRFRQPRADHHGRLLPRRASSSTTRRRPTSRRATRRRGSHKVDKVLVWQRHPGKYSRPTTPVVQGRDFVVNDLLPKYRGRRIEPEQMPAGDAALPHVHERHHRQAQGLPARHRRLPRLRDRHVQVHPGHPSRGRVLVHGRHRLDHRSLLHRLRTARAGGVVGHLRGRAHLPGRRAPVAHRRGAGREHLPHFAHRDSRVCAATGEDVRGSTTTTSST